MATPRVKPEDRKKTGRPTRYTQRLSDAICSELAEGKSLRTICERPSRPTLRTVFYWLRTQPEFLQQYARAKDDSADSMADKIQEVADKTLEGKYDAQAARVAIDAFKWTASKLKPKKYGDRLDLGGGLELMHKKFEEMEDDELDAAIAGAKDTPTPAAS